VSEPMQPSTKWTAVALLVLGFVIRFWASGHARFTGDESYLWSVARELATLEQFPIYGVEVTGSEARHPGALGFYLIAIPQVLGASPRFGALAIIAGHIAVAGLFFLLLLRAKGERAALIGLGAAMFAPWEVLYSDRIWIGCVMPIFGTLAVYAAVRAQNSAGWQTALVAIALVFPQLHLSAPIVWAACLAIVLLRPPERWSKTAIIKGVGIACVLYAPMVLTEIDSGFTNTKLLFAKAGGSEPWTRSFLVPLQTCFHAVLFGSSEMSYHFERGYWGGYDDQSRYFTVAGWQNWFEHQSLIFALGVIVSLAVALVLWGRATLNAVREVRAAALARTRTALSLDTVIFLGIVAALFVGSLLLSFSRKTYYPHYGNVLMPLLLWPIGVAVDAIDSKLRLPLQHAIGISFASMVVNTVQFYENVDGLNGVDATVKMVGELVDEPYAVDLSFAGFDNLKAWNRVARGIYGRELVLRSGAPIRWRVHNDRRRDGPLVERTETLRPKPPDLVWRATEHWRELEVSGFSVCRADKAPSCRYGDQPWQELKTEAMVIGGRYEPLLFMHPIANRTVTARMTIPDAARVIVYYGLSDNAIQQSKALVRVTLRRDGRVLDQFETGADIGLHARELPLSGAGPLELELTAQDEGARFFGFELDVMK
jgi:hypothetical protein